MGGDDMQMSTTPPLNQPPMGNEGMDNMGNDGMEMPMDDNSMNGDENTKEVQELSGKLSQKLGEINSANPNSDLSKYAASMVLSQALKGMDDSDAEEVKSKLNNTENNDNQQMNRQQPQMESFLNLKNMVNEIVNQMLTKHDEKDDFNKEITNPKTKKKNPFNPQRY